MQTIVVAPEIAAGTYCGQTSLTFSVLLSSTTLSSSLINSAALNDARPARYAVETVPTTPTPVRMVVVFSSSRNRAFWANTDSPARLIRILSFCDRDCSDVGNTMRHYSPTVIDQFLNFPEHRLLIDMFRAISVCSPPLPEHLFFEKDLLRGH